MEKKKILCEIHQDRKDPVFDLLCTNKKCPLKGPLCHYCLIEKPHSHMSDEIIPLEEFISKSEKNNDSLKSEAKEKYKNLNDDIEKTQKDLISTFKSLSRKLVGSYGEFLNESEDNSKIITSYGDSGYHSNEFRTDILSKMDFPNTYLQVQEDFRRIESELDIWKRFINNIAERENILKERKIKKDDNIQSTIKNNEDQKINQVTLTKNEANKKEAVLRTPTLHEVTEKNCKSSKNSDTINPTTIETKKNIEKPIIESSPKKRVKTDQIQNNISITNGEETKYGIEIIRLKETAEFENFKYLDIHAITFQLERNIMLNGFSFYQLRESNNKANFDYVLLEGKAIDHPDNKVLISSNFSLENSKNNIMEDIIFKNGSVLYANKFYSLKVINKTKNEFQCYKGTKGSQKEKCFSFFESEKIVNKTKLYSKIQSGQIPRLYFNFY